MVVFLALYPSLVSLAVQYQVLQAHAKPHQDLRSQVTSTNNEGNPCFVPFILIDSRRSQHSFGHVGFLKLAAISLHTLDSCYNL